MEYVLYFMEQGVTLLHPFWWVENRMTAGIKPAWLLILHSGTWARGIEAVTSMSPKEKCENLTLANPS